MNNPHHIDRPDLVKILEDFGNSVCITQNEFITPVVTVTSSEGILMDFTLYILAPEISYEYRAINVELIDQNHLTVRFFTISTKQEEPSDIDISNGYSIFENILNGIQSSVFFRAAIRFLIDQTLLKREYRNGSIRDKIVIGQARTAILENGNRINVGWLRIEGNEVLFYTGKGLSEMWKPNMNNMEQQSAERLKQLPEKELIKQGYLDKKNIAEFIDII